MQACLNGARSRDEHAAVAVTPAACAAEAAAAVDAGATDLHIHPRTLDGRDSLVADDVGSWVRAVREVCDVPVGVTTGTWAWSGGQPPAEAVRAWTVLPDHASVNWHEKEAEALAGALVEQGIALHAGLWTPECATRWLESPWRVHTASVLLELPDAPAQEAVARSMVDLVADCGLPIVLHGEDQSAWPMLDCARSWGLLTRVGLEDMLVGPDGEEVRGNADLLRLAT